MLIGAFWGRWCGRHPRAGPMPLPSSASGGPLAPLPTSPLRPCVRFGCPARFARTGALASARPARSSRSASAPALLYVYHRLDASAWVGLSPPARSATALRLGGASVGLWDAGAYCIVVASPSCLRPWGDASAVGRLLSLTRCARFARTPEARSARYQFYVI